MAKQEEGAGILTTEQLQLLDLVSREPYLCKQFYFTGGTPLAEFYLKHRLSEDIDFFSDQEVHLPSIRTFVKRVEQMLKLTHIDYHQFLGLHSFQFTFPNTEILKVDFNYYPFLRIEKGMHYKNISVDSVLDIAVNKVHTIAMKPRARDFIDVYFILKKYNYAMNELVSYAKAKFDWHIDSVQLGSRFLIASETTDFPRMLKPLDHSEWKNFFIEEARKLKKEIFET